MTVFVILAVRDRAMDAFMQPFFVPALGLGVRSFSDEVNRPESPMFAHPDDYDLFHIGHYDDATALVELVSPPRQVAIGKDVHRAGQATGGPLRRE